MRLKSVISAFLAGTISALMLTGCSIADLGTDNLLRPPKTMGDEAAIEQLIADTTNGKYTLKYPKNGSYKSAIIMKDLDGDDTAEAIAFCKEGDSVTGIHMLVMFDNDGEWELSSDSVTETTDIDCVDFADVNADGRLEILLGSTTYTTNINQLSCYSYADGTTDSISSNQIYSSFYCGDFNADGDDEIISLLLYSTENEASASMLDYNEDKNSLYTKATVSMDPNVVKYKNVTVSPLGTDATGIVIDGSFSNEDINTQIIYYNKELSLLRNPLFKDKSKSFTQRSLNIISSDIDNDSFVEIPAVAALPHPKDSDEQDTAVSKVEWYSFNPNDETTSIKTTMIACYSLKFAIKIPESWNSNTVTATLDTENNCVQFYEWNKSDYGSKLFEIKMFDVADWNKGKYSDDYTLISKDDNHAYTFKNENSESEYSLSDDEIKTAFSALTETTV